MNWKNKEEVREWSKKYNKKYRLENKDKVRKATRDWKLRNPERVKKSNKKYRDKNINTIKNYRDKNNDKIKAHYKQYYKNNKEVILKKNKEYREKNKDRKKQIDHIYYLKNEKKLKNYQKEYYSNPDKKKRRKFITARWRKNNKENYLKNSREYMRDRKKEDFSFKIKQRLRYRLWVAFKNYSNNGKINKSDEYGIDYKKIIEHLKPFPSNIENYHIDHIIPLSKFDFNDKKQIKWAFAPENHQWLTNKENLEKSDRYIYVKE